MEEQIKFLWFLTHPNFSLKISVLDSSGQKESGFIMGNNNWIGFPKECESVQHPLYITLSDRYHRTMKPNLIQSVAPFDVEYRMVYAKHHSPWQVEVKLMLENMLHIGLCLPKSCTNEEIFNLTRKYFNNRLVDVQAMYEIDAKVVQVKDMKLRENFFLKKSVIILWWASEQILNPTVQSSLINQSLSVVLQ